MLPMVMVLMAVAVVLVVLVVVFVVGDVVSGGVKWIVQCCMME